MKYAGLMVEQVLAATYPKKAEEKKPELSKKAQKVQDIVRECFGCEQENVAKLMSVLLGETICVNGEKSQKMAGHAIVCLTNKNNHSYPLNEVIVYTGIDKHYFKKDGTYGNNAPDLQEGVCRLATRKEIEAAFKD